MPQSFSSAKMEALVLVILLCVVVSHGDCMLCGQFAQCTCSNTDSEVYCKGAVPVFEAKGDKHLIWNMENRLDRDVDYSNVLSGYASVKLLQVPAEACTILGLKEFLNCHSSSPMHHDETASPPRNHDETSNEDDIVHSATLVKTSTMTLDLTMTDKAIVITLAITTAKLGVTAFLVYQILVSLVFIHSRINLLEGRSQKPSCIIASTYKYMKCIYCLCNCFCKCWSRRFKPPSFEGRYIFFHF